ncbi:inactive protein RESTRICTED TEV MOVEMENT 2 [Ziziphus jujuba]|uniref:Inactive protein RESTRICTED TEV MOVEMENT 2 n=1 Tax=Ziziphus jujuba TaxID=326968 RepID=A0A6P3Z7R0_ZIZJJ|nr:inactive protein RESTRICTED TEV MOVEMENT 2 [Ziziphus jujuba]
MAEKQIVAVRSPNEANFEPATEWVTNDALDTLMIYVPGFKREKLRVQITSAGKLRISGERQGPTGVNSQFRKEFPIPQNCDTDKISANFFEGIIYVKLPKTKPPAPAPAPAPDVKAQEKPKSATETTPPATAKLPKPATTTTAADQQLKDKNKIAQKQQGPSKEPSRVPTTKDKTGDATIAQQKPPSQKEKQPSKEVGSNKYEESKDLDSKEARAAGADNARSNVNEIKAMEKEKNKDERGKTVVVGKEGEAGGVTDGQPRLEGLVAIVKKPRKLLNLVVGLLLFVVFTLYLKDAISKSFKGESKRSAEL